MSRPFMPRILAAAAAFSIFSLALEPSPSAVGSTMNDSAGTTSPQPTLESPALPSAERIRLAFPGFHPGATQSTGLFPGRVVDQDFAAWPPMRYLGDSALIAGKTFTVQEAMLVPGERYAIVYEPATGNRRAAPEGLRTNLFDFSKNTGVFIPPNSTLVMVKIDVEPEADSFRQPKWQAVRHLVNELRKVLRVSYPGYGESSVISLSRSAENFGEFHSPTHYCLTDGWSYFHVSSLDVDSDYLWFEIVDGEVELAIAIWTLAPTPLE